MSEWVSVQSFESSDSVFIHCSRETGGAGGKRRSLGSSQAECLCFFWHEIPSHVCPFTMPLTSHAGAWRPSGMIRSSRDEWDGCCWQHQSWTPGKAAAQGALPSPLGSPVCKEPLGVKNQRQTLQIHPVPVQPKEKSVIILCNYSQPQRRCFMRTLISCSAPTKGNNVIFKQCWGLIWLSSSLEVFVPSQEVPAVWEFDYLDDRGKNTYIWI